MVKSSHNGNGYQFSVPRTRVDLRRERGLTTQALVWPSRVVVVFQILPKQTFQVPLVQYDHVVQQLPAQCPDHAFGVGILPGAPVGGADLLDAAGLQVYIVSVRETKGGLKQATLQVFASRLSLCSSVASAGAGAGSPWPGSTAPFSGLGSSACAGAIGTRRVATKPGRTVR